MPNLFRCDVQLYHLYVWCKPGRQTEVEDPVEPCTHQENYVRLLQRKGAGRRGRKRMLVRHNALSHRGPHERNLRPVDEGTHLVFRLSPSHAFSNERKRPFGLFKQV